MDNNGFNGVLKVVQKVEVQSGTDVAVYWKELEFKDGKLVAVKDIQDPTIEKLPE